VSTRSFVPVASWSCTKSIAQVSLVRVALLGGDDGGPRSGAVGGAKRSGPTVRSVDGRAHPPKPRMRSIGVVIGTLGLEHGAGMWQ
jgi:hypothetical protein